MLDWMWGYICNAADLIREYADADCGSPERCAEWIEGFETQLLIRYHDHINQRNWSNVKEPVPDSSWIKFTPISKSGD
jgi:hypothetical protein